MTGSLERLLGFLVADPEMSGDAVHHDPLRCVGTGLPFSSQFLDSLAEPIGHAKPSQGALEIEAMSNSETSRGADLDNIWWAGKATVPLVKGARSPPSRAAVRDYRRKRSPRQL
jgi:hypothetical protein